MGANSKFFSLPRLRSNQWLYLLWLHFCWGLWQGSLDRSLENVLLGINYLCLISESKLSKGMWSGLCPQALQERPLIHGAEGRSAAQSQEDCGNDEREPNVPCRCQLKGKEALHQMMHPGKTETLEMFESSMSVAHFA